jgi:four helix bundle protein
VSESPFAFENLEVYKDARAFRNRIYKLARLLPAIELKLKVQMWDAARSLTNNIAEGHGRYTYKDRKHFFTDACASLQELVDDINLCMDEGYAKPEHLEDLRADALRLLKKINGYMKYLRSRMKRPLCKSAAAQVI